MGVIRPAGGPTQVGSRSDCAHYSAHHLHAPIGCKREKKKEGVESPFPEITPGSMVQNPRSVRQKRHRAPPAPTPILRAQHLYTFNLSSCTLRVHRSARRYFFNHCTQFSREYKAMALVDGRESNRHRGGGAGGIFIQIRRSTYTRAGVDLLHSVGCVKCISTWLRWFDSHARLPAHASFCGGRIVK